MKLSDLTWLAGFLEGEGHFRVQLKVQDGRMYKAWKITASSTDEDVLRRAAALMGAPVHGPYRRPAPSRKQHWVTTLARRADAVHLARKLRPHMGSRRQAQIDAMLAEHLDYAPAAAPAS